MKVHILNCRHFALCLLGLFCVDISFAQTSTQNLTDSTAVMSQESDFLEAFSKKYSAVNPALFSYNTNDVYLNCPTKYSGGTNIISPDPQKYPWESRLENGMPNAIVSEYGYVSIYMSSFIAFASKPPSKVGALVYTNNTSSYYKPNWTRPDAGLFWYNAAGQTADEKIVDTLTGQVEPTNIVAVDIESMGMYDQYDVSKNGIKLIYLPQRESHNQIISAYEMNKSFNSDGVLSGFKSMSEHRLSHQVNFTFDFINGDTHMGILNESGNYSFVSRVNAKRSYVKPDETLPFRPDARKRYRRETVTPIGHSFVSQHVSLNVALDMSTPQWEPYSMQPFQMPGFENDIWYGLVTMFGTEGDPDVAAKQRTELAISNDGFHWHYLKPGVPFIDNGTDPNSDDYGCINAAIPVNNTKFSSDRDDLFYFYAASNQRHVSGRNPGVSLAFGRRGAWAGLKATYTEKSITSPMTDELISRKAGPSYSLYNALYLGSRCSPKILSSVTEDPTDKNLNRMTSYAAVLVYALNGSSKGQLLTAVLGAPKKGTTSPSNEYEAVGFTYGGKDASSKYYLIKYFSDLSKSNPNKIFSMSTMDPIPVMLETKLKNATLYGLKFEMTKQEALCPLDVQTTSLYQPKNIWAHSQNTPGQFFTQDFSDIKLAPNETPPVNMVTGTLAINATVGNQGGEQVLVNVYGDSNNNNNMNIVYDSNGNLVYTLNKDGMPFAQMTVSPPQGLSFSGKQVHISVEAVLPRYRKYGKDITDQVTVFRVSCPDLNFEKIVPQPILWDWKHAEGAITDSDRANAQCFAFLEFTSFTPSMNKLSIGSKDSSGTSKFTGTIHNVQFAPTLPEGTNDFWN